MTNLRAVFMDRDGTLIEDAEYLADPEGVKIIPGAPEALVGLRERGFALVVVSNQSGIGRGLITPEDAAAVHERFAAALADHGVSLDAARYCPHTPADRCACRKPLPGLIHEAAREVGVEPAASFMVGDRSSDVEAGRAAGCRTILVGTAADLCSPADFTARDWSDVLAIVDANSEHDP
jgi:D-glycero-D-manno-heptose 1,7-bisphosphate phosphatase